MGRRSRGDGSVYPDKSRPGIWVGSIDLGRDPQTGKRRRPKVSAPTKTECKAKLDELREQQRKTGIVPRRDTTVEMVIRDRLANPPANVKSPVSRGVHEDHGKRIIAALGKVKLVNLTPGQVERFLRDMAENGYLTRTGKRCPYAAKTIRDTRTLLIGAIRRAEKEGLANRNVAALADLPQARRRESKSMTLAEVGLLLDADLTPWWRAFITTTIMCGLRPGELLGLRWEDVDFAARVIRVRKCLKAVEEKGGTALRLEDLKTEQSKRTLRMPAAVAAALAVLRREQAADRLHLGPLYDDHGLVFCSPAGRPRWRQSVATGFKKICERVGIGADWQLREERHTFVSVLSDAHVSIEDISDAVGHINSHVTKTVYRHQIADEITTAAETIDGIFGGKASGA
jgi:integrase